MISGSRGNALVTGAARRIGRAIALALADDGWAVGIHCRNSRAEGKALAGEINSSGRTAYLVDADLCDDTACRRMMAAAAAAAGPVACLVNNASVFGRDTIENVSREGWDQHMNTNLWAPLLLSQIMAAGLPGGRQANIVNIVDERVVNLPPGFISYTTSKAALWAMTRCLALALAPRIRVNAVGPGPTLPSPRQTAEQFALQAAAVPLEHGATAEEIARGVLYILQSPSMTGQLITLDGGQHLGWHFPGRDHDGIEE